MIFTELSSTLVMIGATVATIVTITALILGQRRNRLAINELERLVRSGGAAADALLREAYLRGVPPSEVLRQLTKRADEMRSLHDEEKRRVLKELEP